MSAKWVSGTVVRALSSGPTPQEGHAYAGCGLVHAEWRGEWWLIHLGTGHAICKIRGDLKAALACGTEIAEASDWTFDGLEGWENMDPLLPEKVREIAGKYRTVVGGGRGQSRETAIAVAEMRS